MERARPFPDGIIPPPPSPLHDLNGSELTFVSCQVGSGGSGGGGDSEVVSSGGVGVEGAHYVTHKAPPLALNPPRTCQTRRFFFPLFFSIFTSLPQKDASFCPLSTSCARHGSVIHYGSAAPPLIQGRPPVRCDLGWRGGARKSERRCQGWPGAPTSSRPPLLLRLSLSWLLLRNTFSLQKHTCPLVVHNFFSH